MGRPKVERSTSPVVAANVLKQQKSEALWNEIVETDTKLMRTTGKTVPLRDDLRYLEDRAHGKPMDTVNHLHDKPIEHNVTISYFEVIERARKRALAK